MSAETFKYGFKKTVALNPEDAEARLRDALAAEGFGVLTEIDVQATLKKKLDVDMPPYRILGACAPPLAHQALTAEPDIGLLLPCNVVVYQGEEADQSVIGVLDPVVQLAVTGRDDIRPLADEVQGRMKRVLESL
ncbi:MAG: DUF302 domain-containing protein [Gemmatimonadota bacterium]|jgi:uncharacterized protein (DUF302 family)